MRYQLYPWQEECLKKWQKKQYHGIVNVVTGAGKTYLALAAAMRLEKQFSLSRLRIKIVVPSATLLEQWASAIRFFSGGRVSRRDIGLYYSGRRDTPDRPFMIYVINSARYSLARHILRDLEDGLTVFLIADECHRYTGSENRKIFDFLPFANACPGQYASLGLSATPGLNRPENASVLIPALGPEIFRYGFKEAWEEETLCPYAAFHIALSFTPQEKMEYEELSSRMSKSFRTLLFHYPSLKGLSGSVFFQTLFQIAGENGKYAFLARLYLNASHKRKNLTSDAAARIQCVLKLIGLLDKSTKIIVFGERIEQADLLYEKLEILYPNQAARCHSAMDSGARKLALERFRDSEVRILISCRALDEGFNVPSANVGIVMSSASANRQRTQRLGRILRRDDGKEIASLYYLYIAESSEEISYLPAQSRTDAVCSLSYHLDNDTISHPAYEKLAGAAMERFRRDKPDAGLLKEAGFCFRRGIVRPDWQMGKAYCTEKIKAAKTVSERNYWICMKQIAT
ncbi:MAG: DEAD/DEAH box helicase [Enterocloster aldenensis]